MRDDVFVSRKLDQFESVTKALEEKGFSYRYVVLKKEVVEANKFISEKLQVPLATKIFSYQKIRIVEDVPRSIENVYIDYSRVVGIEKMELENKSLYKTLKDEFGYNIKRNEEEIRIVRANKLEAEQLNIDDESEVLMVEGLTYIDSVKPFEFFQIISIPSFFKFRGVNLQ